ncbi:EthD domain-containing protein (plasmid) [Nocardioides sp. R1-1]|uniref:EthD domain-containing protein n=1 Tax=Nocardioides sp. R1-1 TaxID=3383502 RepID=UPI0038D168F5
MSHPRGLGGDAPYLVAELWFDGPDVMKAAMKSPEMAETAAHAKGFAVASMSMFTGEVHAVS